MTLAKYRITAVILILVGVLLGYFVYASQRAEEGSFLARFPFVFGLDLSGGTHLVYDADLSSIAETERDDSLEALRDIIERRVNIFGVTEPLVQVEQGLSNASVTGRLIVELPGVTDLSEATRLIGETPVLDFRAENSSIDRSKLTTEGDGTLVYDGAPILPEKLYESPTLTGKHIKNAQVQFNNVSGEPFVSLSFTDEGSDIFARLTRENFGKTLGIFLDGSLISAPVVQEEITGGQAQITGRFTLDEAKTLVGRLNAGALPVPISLISTESVGSSLGASAISAGVFAGALGFLFISIFMIFWYRLPGFVAVCGLLFYVALTATLFKIIPVTLTAAGIAGFVISLGLAVDANVLIFARLAEEKRAGKSPREALQAAFSRAWTSIRDANVTSIFTAIILFWFGTSIVKGFALTLGIGVLVSLFSATVFVRMCLLSFSLVAWSKKTDFLFGSGVTRSS